MYFGNQNFGDALTGPGLQGALWGGIGGAVVGGIAGGIAYKPNNVPGGPPNKPVGPGGELIETYSTHKVTGGGNIVKQGASITDGVTHTDDFVVTANRLPFARSSINGLSVTNPAGSNISIAIPDNYGAIATLNGKGIIYGPQGVSTSNMANAIRVHLKPTSYAPNGYVVFYNSYGQAFDPNTGRTLGQALWHFLIP